MGEMNLDSIDRPQRIKTLLEVTLSDGLVVVTEFCGECAVLRTRNEGPEDHRHLTREQAFKIAADLIAADVCELE